MTAHPFLPHVTPHTPGRRNMVFIEKRKFTRIAFEIDARVTSGGSVIQSDKVRNVSLGGMFIHSREPLPQGAQCEVEMGVTGPATSLQMRVEGEVVRVETEGFAIRFTKMDVDSLIYLRHLIRIRCTDPEQHDREYCTKLLQIDPKK